MPTNTEDRWEAIRVLIRDIDRSVLDAPHPRARPFLVACLLENDQELGDVPKEDPNEKAPFRVNLHVSRRLDDGTRETLYPQRVPMWPSWYESDGHREFREAWLAANPGWKIEAMACVEGYDREVDEDLTRQRRQHLDMTGVFAHQDALAKE